LLRQPPPATGRGSEGTVRSASCTDPGVGVTRCVEAQPLHWIRKGVVRRCLSVVLELSSLDFGAPRFARKVQCVKWPSKEKPHVSSTDVGHEFAIRAETEFTDSAGLYGGEGKKKPPQTGGFAGGWKAYRPVLDGCLDGRLDYMPPSYGNYDFPHQKGGAL
jgi:hypothetical protein